MRLAVNNYAQGASAILTDHNIAAGETAPDDAEARFRLNTDGRAQGFASNVGVYEDYAGEWLASGSAGDFECRMTTVSGTVTSGTIGSWEALSSSREWTRNHTASSGNSDYVGTLEIRRVADGVIVATATITLQAEVSA